MCCVCVSFVIVSPVILDCGSVGVLVGIGNPLRWKSIHLLVDLGSVGIESGSLLLAGNLELALLECEGIAGEGLLQLGCLRVEAIIILPLVFKINLIIDSKSKSSKESQRLENANLAIKG